GACPAGWYMEKGFCYKVFTTTKTFWQAVDLCVSENSALLSLFNQTEIDFLNKVCKIWIGVKQFQSDGRYYWLDGTLENYTSI
ncbi:hypothetical protein LOTGIDRAFT_84995, partial [Lottia gigantea]